MTTETLFKPNVNPWSVDKKFAVKEIVEFLEHLTRHREGQLIILDLVREEVLR